LTWSTDGTNGDVPIQMEDVKTVSAPVEHGNAVASILPAHLFPQAARSGGTGHFELDENTLKSFQQFMELQGVHPDAAQNTVE
jgi:hypothetical protein